MNKRKLSFFGLSLLLPVVVLALILTAVFPQTTHAAPNGTITVTNIDDSGVGSLRQAIADAADDDTIEFSLSGTIVLASELVISKSLTINGDDLITVSGNNVTRVFNVMTSTLSANVDVTFDSLRIISGNVQTTDCGTSSIQCGGGIILQNSAVAVTVTNSTLSGNSTLDGGGIYNNSGTLTVINSTFSENSARDGGGIYNNSGTLTTINSTFSENSAIREGGGIFNDSGTITVSDSTFSGNLASSNGGGIRNYYGTVTVSNTTFSGNSANRGGGIHNIGTITVSNTTFSGNSASASGGGLRNFDGTLTVSNSIIANSTNGGDCINNDSLATVTDNGFNLIEDSGANACGLVNNTNGNIIGDDPVLGSLQDNGGDTLTYALLAGSPAIDAGDCSSGPATDQRGIARPQDATCDSGAVEMYACANTIAVMNSDSRDFGSLRHAIIDVCEDGLITFDTSLTDSTIDISPNGELLVDKSLTISSTVPITVSGNNVTRVFNVTAGDVTFDNLSIINGNVQTADCGGAPFKCGGGIILQNSTVVVTVTNSTLSGNSARYGGGIDNEGGTLTVINSTLSGNSATTFGGGINNYYGTFTVNHSTFSGNSANSRGGGIFNDNGTLTVGNSIIANSIGGDCGRGGTVTVHDNGFNLIEDDGTYTCGLVNNTNGNIIGEDPMLGSLQDNGGNTLTYALLAGSPAIDAGNCSSGPAIDQRGEPRRQDSSCDIGAFELNAYYIVNVKDDSDDGSCDALAAGGVDCTLREAINAANRAVDDATITFAPAVLGTISIGYLGELEINSNMVIHGGNVITVSGQNVVRVFNVTAGDVTFDSLNIIGGHMQTSYCVAGSICGGGGIVLQNNSVVVTVTNSTLSGNEADDGGGIYNDNGTLTVINSTLSGNAAYNFGRDARGGGIYNDNGTVMVINSTLSGNSAKTHGAGGGIYNTNGALTVSNSTLSGNSAVSGGGIYNNGTVTIGNSTLSGNSTYYGGGGIRNYDGTLTVSNSIIANSTSDTGGGDCNNGGTGTVIDNGFNLIEDSGVNACGLVNNASGNIIGEDPVLGSLADNGGSTLTHALLPDSPAIDAGDDGSCPTYDQRGIGRHDGDDDPFSTCDIGAYEGGTMICGASSASVPFTIVYPDQSDIALTFDQNPDYGADCFYVDEVPASHPNATGSTDGTNLRTGIYWRFAEFDGDTTASGNGTFTLTMKLPHNNLFNPKVCKYPGSQGGSGWDCYTPTISTTAWVTLTNVTEFSDWAVGSNVGPTAVSLQTFSANLSTPVALVGVGLLALLLVTAFVLRKRNE